MTTIGALRAALADGSLTPSGAVAGAYDRIAALGDPAAVISIVPREVAVARAESLVDPALPLFGLPFAVKDNIDVAGVATTAGCPAYRYVPQQSAEVVRRLEAAGAVVVAKTNLDQFATGLVGTRSPYGTPRNPWDPSRVPGGSSSGSAVLVAFGAVPFALGTDTAGSGRVPAAFTGIVGAKPTRGWISTGGVVPAVRSIDCVSVFALSTGDAWQVLTAAGGFDPADPFSRRPLPPPPPTGRVGLGGAVDPRLLEALGSPLIDVDLEPFLAAGRLLYDGPWVAERLAALRSMVEGHAGEMDPTVRAILAGAARWSAADSAAGAYELAALKRRVEAVFSEIDVLVVPTAPAAPTVAEVLADPLGANAPLGEFTSWCNLLDLCAFAVPTGVVDGLPTGLQVVAPAWADATAAAVADRIHRTTGGLQGVTGSALGAGEWRRPAWSPAPPAAVELAVVGAHLAGEPLHHQLTDAGAELVEVAVTAPSYRLYALDTDPAKPGLVRTGEGCGGAIAVEVYRLPVDAFGRFVAGVPSPMCIGSVALEHRSVPGFLCEPAALEGAADITSHGGWRAYLRSTGAGGAD